MDGWTSLLKVLSMLLAGLFGILALATEYKDESKKITRWGKIALGGILISTLLSLVLYTLEASNAKAAAKKAEADASKREQEAQTFANSLETLLVKALDGVTKQEQALQQLETVRSDSQATLQGQKQNLLQTSQVSKGLETTLTQQNELLHGQEKTIASQLQQTKLQEKVLDESRLLYLAQYKLSGVEISWVLSREVIKRIKDIFDEIDPVTKLPKFKDAVDLKRAVDAGGNPEENYIGVKLDRNHQPKLVWSLRRPQGFTGREYPPESIEGQALGKALRFARPSFFYVKIEPGTSIAEMDQSHYPPQIVISGGRAFFIVENPDVKLSQLQDVIFSFQALESEGGDSIPKQIRIKLLDEKVDFNAELSLDWADCITKKVVTFDSAEGIVYGEGVCAKTPPLSANFDRLLNPLRSAEIMKK